MNKIKREEAKTEIIDHLGLVAATVQDIGLIEKIDALLPVSEAKGAKLTMGERIAGMILNGLGFVDDRLYMFSKFLKNKPVSRLLGEHISAEDYTDDALGRCLDAIYEFGPTKLFSQLAFSIGLEKGLLGKASHVDTTSLSLFGEYVPTEADNEAPKPALGFAKGGQRGLKQMVLNLATTGKEAFPIWMEAHAGNGSDSKILPASVEKIDAHCKLLEEAPDFLHVADSAMYEGCQKINRSIKWLSRVPERSKKAKSYLLRAEEDFAWQLLENGYRISGQQLNINGLPQRWILVFSQQAYEKGLNNLERQICKEQETIEKQIKKLSTTSFSCPSDAQKALKEISKKLKYHLLKAVEIKHTKHYDRKGKPRATDVPTKKYQIFATAIRNEKVITTIKQKKGRFILATNELDQTVLSDQEVLETYKDQQKTERGFRFIKGDAFEVSSVFLKKPTRIAALMMIMTLCLMIYGLIQYQIRQALVEKEEYLPNQLGKLTQAITAQWIFRCCLGIHLLKIQTASLQQEMVINLTPLREKIIRLLGKQAMAIYGITPSI